MNVTIVTCYESNEERVGFVLEACRSRNYTVTVITTDFSHIKKNKRNNIPAEYQFVETKPYSKNLSASRLISHRHFSVKAFQMIENQNPELIWLMVPANSLIKEARKYKEKHPDVRIIIDVIDMWPESLPVTINKNAPPFNIWKKFRSENIGCSDFLITECDLYHDILGKEYPGEIMTIHWPRGNDAIIHKVDLPDDILSLCYVGSINNIIDADRMAAIISDITMPVVLHVIGEGESVSDFLEKLKKVCEVIYHGPIRDEDKKTEIFDLCHAGMNVYRDGLFIGLTVKCIDYFEHGLPIINNIKGDTWRFVEEYGVGINIDDDNKVDTEKLIKMRKNNNNIYELFNSTFTKKVFIQKCLMAIDRVVQ